MTTRIENRAGGGLPDVFCLVDGLPLWVELKAFKFEQLKISPHQVAWHASFARQNGLSFFLARSMVSGYVHLHSGRNVTALASGPISGVDGQVFRKVSDVWGALGDAARAHYVALLQHKGPRTEDLEP